MLKGKKVLAIIPARAGSKRLVDKNTKALLGKPLIGWTIESALLSKYVDKVVVSTDSTYIQEIAQELEAEAPFIRPKELATDSATTVDVIAHCIEHYHDESFDIVILLQPTSPLRDQLDIDNALEFYSEKVALSVISVCPLEHPSHWCNTLPEDRNLKSFIKSDSRVKRSQDFEKEYRLNGALYISDINSFKENNGFWTNNASYAFVMAPEKSIDIDTQSDFELCEYFMLKRQANANDK